jgi:hypothetical protein
VVGVNISIYILMGFSSHQIRSDRKIPDTKISKTMPENVAQSKSRSTKASSLPIPKGNSAYARAKREEYQEKNLLKAERLYKQALYNGERTISAAKDLAGVMHQ